MDFKEFRQNKVWVLVEFGPRIQVPDDDPESETGVKLIVDMADPRTAVFKIAYRPQSMSDADAEYISQWNRARVMDYKGIYDDPEEVAEPVEENRAQKRAREKSERRAAATPARAVKDRPTYAEMLARIICDWDVVYGQDEDGNDIPWPVNKENIETIDYAIRLEMMTTIMMDYLDRPNLTALSRRFSATTRPANGQTTQTSSSEPIDINGSRGNS